jgi:integrase
MQLFLVECCIFLFDDDNGNCFRKFLLVQTEGVIIMGTTEPIRNSEELTRFREYYHTQQPHLRNYTLIMLGLHSALRVSDLLHLRWDNVYDFDRKRCRDHLTVTEQKTQKKNCIALCPDVKAVLNLLHQERKPLPDDYIFSKKTDCKTPLCRSQAYRIVRTAAQNSIQEEHISCHSLRKTFGYQAWKQGVPPAMLMDIFNHSSYEITKRYLGINQDERDGIFLGIRL